ncbi:MAG: hypothetical protein GX364_00270 [Firmicutes bacterium]|jgi:stage III sporulation protein AB|nr:hypothetical protein [Bacillota bacterium]
MSGWIFKLCGALCVVSACYLWGEFKARSFTVHLQQLQQFRQAFNLLSAEISYTGTPLPAAFKNISARIGGAVGNIFEEAAERILAGGDVSAGEAWREAVSDTFPRLSISQDDRRIIGQLGASLGMVDREGQIKQIGLVLSLLEDALQDAHEKRQRNERMWRYLGLLGGLMLVIIFI